jgi:allophanate hydrolase subunit 2
MYMAPDSWRPLYTNLLQQVRDGVVPIALLNDAVTGGGYATIATIISADRDAVAQSKTHDRTRFVSVPIEAALEARAQRRRRLDEVRDALS